MIVGEWNASFYNFGDDKAQSFALGRSLLNKVGESVFGIEGIDGDEKPP